MSGATDGRPEKMENITALASSITKTIYVTQDYGDDRDRIQSEESFTHARA